MQKGARLSDDLSAVTDCLTGSDGGLAQLRQAARRLDRIAGEYEPLSAVLEALDRAVIEAGEAEDKLAEAAEALSFDPARLDAIETRLFDLRGLARKHQVAPDDLAALRDEMAARLAAIEGGEEHIAALEADVARKAATYRAAAQALSAERQLAAGRLDAAVAGELAPLKLDAARFRTVVAPLDEGQWSGAGMDRLHPRAQGRAGGAGRGRHVDLRRDRPGCRRRGGRCDRRAPVAPGTEQPDSRRHPQPPGRGARCRPYADRQVE